MTNAARIHLGGARTHSGAIAFFYAFEVAVIIRVVIIVVHTTLAVHNGFGVVVARLGVETAPAGRVVAATHPAGVVCDACAAHPVAVYAFGAGAFPCAVVPRWQRISLWDSGWG